MALLDTLELYSPTTSAPDGFQTLYGAICRKLAEGPTSSSREDRDGKTTEALEGRRQRDGMTGG